MNIFCFSFVVGSEVKHHKEARFLVNPLPELGTVVILSIGEGNRNWHSHWVTEVGWEPGRAAPKSVLSLERLRNPATRLLACHLISSARTSVPTLPLLPRSRSCLSFHLPLCIICLSWPLLPSFALFPGFSWQRCHGFSDASSFATAMPGCTPPGLPPGFSSLRLQACFLNILLNEWICIKLRQRFKNFSLVHYNIFSGVNS